MAHYHLYKNGELIFQAGSESRVFDFVKQDPDAEWNGVKNLSDASWSSLSKNGKSGWDRLNDVFEVIDIESSAPRKLMSVRQYWEVRFMLRYEGGYKALIDSDYKKFERNPDLWMRLNNRVIRPLSNLDMQETKEYRVIEMKKEEMKQYLKDKSIELGIPLWSDRMKELQRINAGPNFKQMKRDIFKKYYELNSFRLPSDTRYDDCVDAWYIDDAGKLYDTHRKNFVETRMIEELQQAI